VTVAVVGGGLAGATAALAAARHRDARVVLVSQAGTGLRVAGGLVDVLGYTPDGEGPLADPFAAMADLPADHPYRTVGPEAVRAGLDLFDGVTGDRYAGGGRNALVGTVLGSLKPTARYPRSVAPGVCSRERPTLLLGFERLPAFDAPLAAARLDDALPYRVWGETVALPGSADSLETTDLAAAVEDDHATPERSEGDGAGAGGSVRDVLAGRLLDRSIGDERVGFPAALGYGAVEEVREGLAAAAGAEVFEVPTGPPSVPGRRLERTLRGALEAAGVDVREARATGADAADGRVSRLHLADGQPLETEAAVLATGGPAGGFESDRRGVRDPVFGCRVPHPEDRAALAAEGVFDDQPFAALGVDTDGELRPLDARGAPEYDNLRAAGAVLGGYDPAAELSAGGVSLATGRVAGRLAAEDAA